MERLTKQTEDGQAAMDCKACKERHIDNQDMYCSALYCRNRIKDRLGVIEDILGDKYDLARLREIVDADRDGRCMVLPCKDWLDIVFGDQEVFYGIDAEYIENPIRQISVDSSSRCTWYNGWKTVVLKGYDENGFDWEFSPKDVGKTVFLTREAAEAALKGERDG